MRGLSQQAWAGCSRPLTSHFSGTAEHHRAALPLALLAAPAGHASNTAAMGSEAVLPPPGSGSRVQRAAQAVMGADRRAPMSELCPPPQPTAFPAGLSFCPFPPACLAPSSSTCCSFPCRVHTTHRGFVCMCVCNSIKQNTMKSGRDAVRQQFPTLSTEPACALVTRGFACSSPRDSLLEVPIPHLLLSLCCLDLGLLIELFPNAQPSSSFFPHFCSSKGPHKNQQWCCSVGYLLSIFLLQPSCLLPFPYNLLIP